MDFFYKCPFLSKYNLSTSACPSQSKNRGSKHQPPLPNAAAVTVGWKNETGRGGGREPGEGKAWRSRRVAVPPMAPAAEVTPASWGSSGGALAASSPWARCCRICFLCITSLILTSWGAALKNLLLSKDISHSTSKLRLWLCLSSLKMGYFSFPNYPNVVLLFITPLTKTINETARVYSRWANTDRHQSMSTNAQINWFFKHVFLGTKNDRNLLVQKKKSF